MTPRTRLIAAHTDVPGHALDPARFIRQLYEDVLSFSGGTEQSDDLTALVIKSSV